ncbi:hypothetical protein P2W68_17905 [Chryseobacterium arthrosphaerae]|uniref:hypothetical protein n=1 Tax=Chryseobacterium arthrosphaerae TaxID=651561 RepID=UPI0023E3477F|nr:hypothetical protein [Chryseobacterium arthrosphaerae]WES96710.1 hypothetical protein P2W68_17905 [Chryseobacterium arthrosphaerae]
MMKTKLSTAGIRLLLLALLLTFGAFYSQANNGAVGINTTTPNPNSVLDVVPEITTKEYSFQGLLKLKGTQ